MGNWFAQSPGDEQRMFDALRAQSARRQNYISQATPAISGAIGQFHRLSPYSAPGVALAAGTVAGQGGVPVAVSAAAANAALANGHRIAPQATPDPTDPGFTSTNQDSLAAIQAMTPEARTQYLQAEQKQLGIDPSKLQPSKNEIDWGDPLGGFKAIGEGLKGIVRESTTLAQSGLEMVQTRAAQGTHALGDIASSLKEGDLSGAGQAFLKAEATVNPFSVVSLATSPEAAKEASEAVQATTAWQHYAKNLSVGQGFFPNPESPAGQYQAGAAREVRGTINGSAWTVGRQVASLAFEPGTTPYNVASGLTDSAVAWYADPANIAVGKLSELRAASKVFEPAADAAGVLVNDIRKGVNPRSVDGWFQSRTGQSVVADLAADTSRASIHKALGGNAPVEVVDALARTSDPNMVQNILRPVLGNAIRSTSDIAATTLKYKAYNQIDRVLPDFARSRQFASVPSRVLKIGADATPADLSDAVTQADNWMKLVEVPAATRTALVDSFIQKMAEGDRFGAADDLYHGIRQGLVAQGVDPDQARAVTRMFDDYDRGLYGVDEMGRNTSWAYHVNPSSGQAEDVSLAGPGLLSERLRSNVEMPDPRQLKRITSITGKLVSKGGVEDLAQIGKELKLPFAAAEDLTNIWKRFTILRIATAVRVAGDEQARLAMSDMPSLFNHPFHWIMMVAGREKSITALGEHFDDAAALGNMAEYSKALGRSFFGALRDPNQLHGATFSAGHWNTVTKDALGAWKEGMATEIRQLAADPIARRVAAGDNTDDIVSWLRSDGSKVYDDLKQMGASGRATVDSAGRRGKAVIDYGDENELRNYIDGYYRQRIAAKVGDNQQLLNVISRNALDREGIAQYEAQIANKDLQFLQPGTVGDADWGTSSRWLGATVKNRETGEIGVVTRDLGAGQSTVSYSSKAAFEGGSPSDGLMSTLDDWAQHPNSPDMVKHLEQVTTHGNRPNVQARLDQATSKLVSGLFNYPVSKLTRSPAFREAYYGEMARYAEHLTPEEANKLLRNLDADAKAKGFAGKVSDFVGGDKTRDAVIENARKASGTMTVSDLDYYAKGHALDQVLDLLYDSTRHSNFGDAMRTIVPFGQAFAEVFGSWGKVLARHPETIRKTQLLVNGARDAGFFYTDPTTGQEMFTVPGADWIVKRITGQDIQVGAPVAGLNLVGGFLPTLGPVVQIPAAWLFQRTPPPDWVANMVMPYGSPPMDENSATGGLGDLVAQGVLPGWAKTLVSIASSPDSTSQYGNIYTMVLKQLAASGKYSNDDTGRQQMKDDAETKARTLALLQSVGKFTLPSSPSYDWKAATKQGDMLVSALASDFHRMQSEDYNTAVQRFVDTYGEAPYAYVQSKTKSVNGGLDASQEFGHWEQAHSSFMDTYPAVGGYFGPTGADFDYTVYNRQVSTGERKKLTGDELINATQSTLARMKYYAAKDQMGTKLNADQQAWLRGYKEALIKDYPGWGYQPSLDPGDFNTKVAQLKDAASSKSMADNDTAEAVRSYLKLRDQALTEAKNRGYASITGEKTADLQAWLSGFATQLIRDHAGFARVYDQLLSQEVEPSGK